MHKSAEHEEPWAVSPTELGFVKAEFVISNRGTNVAKLGVVGSGIEDSTVSIYGGNTITIDGYWHLPAGTHPISKEHLELLLKRFV